MSHPFANIPVGKLESLNALQAQFVTDNRPEKADLMCGVYQTQQGTPYVFPSVKLARQMMADDPEWEHEYPSSHLGEAAFRDLSARLLFGEDSIVLKENRLASMQTLGASGACHMGAKFLRLHYEPYKANNKSKMYIPAESWANHVNAFQYVGFDVETIPYYNAVKHSFDIEAFTASITDIPDQSVVVLQVCGNNPTGCDPTPQEWQALAQTFKAKGHFAFLDLSYPGFGSGSVYDDCAPIRLFTMLEIPLALAVTYGKSFGLYGERVGHFCLPLPTEELAKRAETHMKLLARAETGAQPRFGAKIIVNILKTPHLKAMWEEDLRGLAIDLDKRRKLLQETLTKNTTTTDWSFVTDQRGMFLFTSFDAQQITYLREECAVYLQDTGRLSIAGLNSNNIPNVAKSMAEADKLRKD